MPRLRLAFMGTPGFACPALDALLAVGHEVAAVYSQPARPAERGQKLRPSPVQALAERHGIPVRTPRTLRDPEVQASLAASGLDAAVVVAYGLILPGPVLEAPRLGCLNIHASLLPRWRGAAPIQHAILAGDRETGVTIMEMDEGLDTGPMLLSEAVPIGPKTTAAELHDRLSALGARLVVEALEGLAAGRIAPVPQPGEGATYAPKLARADGAIAWADAAFVDRQVRALNPWPGTGFTFRGETIKVLAAERVADASGPAGAVLDGRLTVACGAGGAVRPTRLQRPGRPAMAADAFLRGFPIPAGTRLPAP